MKREKILLYICSNKIFLYLINKKKEVIEEVDTSLFFKCGEIKNVKELEKTLRYIFNKNKILGSIIKSNIVVLYNNITNSDITELYKSSLECFDFNRINFINIESLLIKLNNYPKIIYYDGETYTSFHLKEKETSINCFASDSVFIGDTKTVNTHYSKKELIWEMFKSDFTKC